MLAFRAHLALFSDKTKRCRETSAVGRGCGAGSGCSPGHRASQAAEIRPPVRAGCLPPHPAGLSAPARPCRSALVPLPPPATVPLPERGTGGGGGRPAPTGREGGARSSAAPGAELAGSRHGGCPRGATGIVLRAQTPRAAGRRAASPGCHRGRGEQPPQGQRDPAPSGHRHLKFQPRLCERCSVPGRRAAALPLSRGQDLERGARGAAGTQQVAM